MPAPVPEPIRGLIQYEFELGYSNDSILAGPYRVSRRTLQSMRATWRRYGTVFIPSESIGGCPRVMSDLHEQELLRYLDQRPMAYLDEMAYFLLDEYELAVSETTVWRTLRRLGWSRKLQRKITQECNTLLRSA